MGKIRLLFRNYIGPYRYTFVFSSMVLFWAIFDTAMTYVTPLIMKERGFSNSMIGILISTSSMFGAVFDFIISKIFKRIDFRRLFLFLFLLCAVYSLVLFYSTFAGTVLVFLVAMAIWGIYWDFYGFGVFNFISKNVKSKHFSFSFSSVHVFKTVGTIIAPLIIGVVILDGVDWRSFVIGWFFLGVSFLFFLDLVLSIHKKKNSLEKDKVHKNKNFLREIYLWRRIGTKLAPVLLLTFYLFFIDAFFWTLAPLYAETLNLGIWGGLFITAYSLPAVFIGWFVVKFTKKIGKKRLAFLGLLIGSILLSSFSFLNSIYLIIPITFFAAFFISMSLPSINSAYADFISGSPLVEEEIEGLEDFAFNVGFILGPLCAGILADVFSIPVAFSILGTIGFFLALFLIKKTPRKIKIDITKKEIYSKKIKI